MTARKLTSMTTDVRQIARLLQAKAPPGHKLAYINEEEAALLKSRGGSGRITEAGIPSYDPVGDSDGSLFSATSAQPLQVSTDQPQQTSSTDTSAPTVSTTDQTSGSSGTTYAPTSQTDFQPNYTSLPGANVPTNAPVTSGLSPSVDYTLTPQGTTFATGGAPVGVQQGVGDTGNQPLEPTPPKEKPSTLDNLLSKLGQPQALAALGIGGTEALLGAYQVRKAKEDAQQAQQQLQALASPYQTQGQQLQQQAQQGQLTPANQQILQAAQAQLAQGAGSRGGVGVAQAQTQLANIQAGLLQNQMNLGLQVQAVGDKIAQGAIQTGIQADQYINTLTSNYASNIARVVAGGVGGTQQTTTTTTTGAP